MPRPARNSTGRIRSNQDQVPPEENNLNLVNQETIEDNQSRDNNQLTEHNQDNNRIINFSTLNTYFTSVYMCVTCTNNEYSRNILQHERLFEFLQGFHQSLRWKKFLPLQTHVRI